MRRETSTRLLIAGSSVACGLLALVGGRSLLVPKAHDAAASSSSVALSPSSSSLPNGEIAPAPSAEMNEEGDDEAHAFRAPSGEPSGIRCEAARAIVAQTRRHLAYEPRSPQARALADATADWLDPHGLWSAAPDSPVDDALVRRARELLRELEGSASSDCPSAREVGATLVTWVSVLRRDFDAGRLQITSDDAITAASDALFESGTVTRPARALATRIGMKVGAIERTLGPAGADYARAARARFFPELDAIGWSRVVLAAAVRAYVPLVDPHGAWAPADEEASVYEVDLEAAPPERLWEKSARTALGLRIDSGPLAPLLAGDVVLALGGIVASGLPLEQLEQLALAVADGKADATAVVLRPGEATPRAITLGLHQVHPSSSEEAHPPVLTATRVAYGDGDALVIGIPDVHDDLGDELAHTLLRERQREGRKVVGVALDLRGNGGGSTDGAIAALGLFLPGSALFPMKRRDGSIETDRAPEPPMIDRWTGPVASFVDGDTASAAEMMSGALTAYHRGPSVGSLTFGKGCAQEYLDDDASAGVLRLTTLLYALPDGSPVQRVGLHPTYKLAFAERVAGDGDGTETGEANEKRPPIGAGAHEREVSMPHAPPTWRGPDVRDGIAMHRTPGEAWLSPWPSHGGNVGPCKDVELCRALRALGASPPQTVAKRISKAR